MFGLLNLHKPPGISSRRALNDVQRLVRPEKVGHAGTLDPLATGVLVVTVGAATRLTSYIQRWPKKYRGTFLLGRSSETEDIDGCVVELHNSPVPKQCDLERVLPQFRGVISQQPPSFSALKVDGKRAYALARAGESIELAARMITIYAVTITRYAYPELTLEIECGSGTYIRSLGRDLARAVGTEAVMASLVRTAVGHLELANSVSLDQLNSASLPAQLLPAAEATRDLPAVHLDPQQLPRVACGLAVSCPGQSAPELAGLTADGDLAAVLSRQAAGWYRPKRNFIARQ